ncbi:MAG TPA: hypothetical protein VH415_11590 [Nitrososphaeraceae archaeon]|jgi:hypothetical protein
MNSYSSFTQFHNQEKLAKEHRDNIIYAFMILKKATSGEIKKFTDNKVKSDLDEKYNSSKYLSKDKKQISQDKLRELRQKQMSKRTIQKYLIRLEKEYLLTKDKYNVYTLTTQGTSKKIYGEAYGKTLFNDIMKQPLTENPSEKFLETIKRIGIYISYTFVKTMLDKSFHKSKEEKYEWINDVINPSLMFDWFNDKLKSFDFNVDPEIQKYITTLQESEVQYYSKIYPNLQDKQIEALKRRARELEQKLGISS